MHPIPQEAFDWYDEYAHGLIDRRTFVTRLSTLTAAGLTLGGLLGALMPDYAEAAQVSFNDPDITARYETFPAPLGHGEGRGYLVRPVQAAGEVPSSSASEPRADSGSSHGTSDGEATMAAPPKWPAVLVVHENRGLNPYIEDVARRLAKAGFMAFAPDALAPLGGYPGNDDEGRAMQRSLDRAKIEQDFIAAAGWLDDHPHSTGKLGAVGFCFGGYVVNMLAATVPERIDAAVPFYGTPPAKEIRANIRGPLLVQMAENDERVNALWPEYEADLVAAGVDFTVNIYAGTQHGFHNDSTARYNETAAALAWSRVLAFFEAQLG